MLQSGSYKLRLRLILPALTGLFLLFGPLLAGCERAATEEEVTESASYYEERGEKSEGGTGRYYLGREIAEVLGHPGAEWMDRPAREVQELPGRVIQALDLRPADVVADIGAGTGYFTFRIAPHVPYGKVYAVDIDEEMLRLVQEKMEETGIKNVVPHRGSVTSPHLPAGQIDVVLIVDAYHEFSHPREMMEGIREALKPGGRVVLVEYRGEDETLPVAPVHRMTEEQARKEMSAVGLIWRETKDYLPQQHILIFEKPVD